MRIKIINAKEWNWYKVGEVFEVKDVYKYADIGIQVVRKNNERCPDVVSHGDYEHTN